MAVTGGAPWVQIWLPPQKWGYRSGMCNHIYTGPSRSWCIVKMLVLKKDQTKHEWPIFTYIYPIYLYLPILTYIYPHFIPIYAPYNQIYTNRTIALFASASNSLAGWIHHRHLFLVNIKVHSLSFHVIQNPLYPPLPSVSPSLSPGWLWDASSVRNPLLQQLTW